MPRPSDSTSTTVGGPGAGRTARTRGRGGAVRRRAEHQAIDDDPIGAGGLDGVLAARQLDGLTCLDREPTAGVRRSTDHSHGDIGARRSPTSDRQHGIDGARVDGAGMPVPSILRDGDGQPRRKGLGHRERGCALPHVAHPDRQPRGVPPADRAAPPSPGRRRWPRGRSTDPPPPVGLQGEGAGHRVAVVRGTTCTTRSGDRPGRGR